MNGVPSYQHLSPAYLAEAVGRLDAAFGADLSNPSLELALPQVANAREGTQGSNGTSPEG
jgi:hypothetical protein